ncbi:MAG: hypothetical protein QMD66_05115 [Actinomycetota bacterium]|nr:hypothetical protein [Actinomycetota bacterium]
MRKLLLILGLAMCGEGLVCLITPKSYLKLWKFDWAPADYNDLLDNLSASPGLVRALAAAELALGMWLTFHELSRRREN